MQVKRTGAGLMPTVADPVMPVCDNLAQLARERPSLGAQHRHRRQQPGLLVIEIEMPRNAGGAAGGLHEARKFLRRTAHRQFVAQPVSVGERGGRAGRLPRRVMSSRLQPLAGGPSGHKFNSRAGLSPVMRARRR